MGKSPFSGPCCVLDVSGIRRLVVQIKAMERGNLVWRGGFRYPSFYAVLLSSLELGDTKVYAPQTRARLGTTESASTPPAPRVGSNRRAQAPDLYWLSPESGGLWRKPEKVDLIWRGGSRGRPRDEDARSLREILH